ncbi:hypothetical protein TrST_g13553 [Triparma strigata]|uniref:sphinganine-1-phosphate aldolase n=1 Tax=Triparma strigata TaxID=1606541 RepID=A0A9W6ZK55_9STRA|nr:hypothetical protein TrST_g13553 [Triparma strigata]
MDKLTEQLTLANVEHAVCAIVAINILSSAVKSDPRKVWKKIFTAVVDFLGAAVPGVQGVLDGEKNKALADIEKDMHGDGDPDANLIIPAKGMSKDALHKKAEALKAQHTGFKSGKKWGGIYHEPGSEVTEVQAKMWGLFNSTNSLYPGVFPSVRKFEAEVIAMTTNMVNGSCGLLSSGGTESILLAVLAYREQGLKRGITSPNMICCVTAHPAIFKACKYFNVELIKAPFDPKTFQLTPAIVKKYLNRNTVAIYASAPNFSHGVLDDVEGLGPLAQSKKIGLHVDNCLGGFLLSYLQKENLLNGRNFDFSVPGVTTMSVDLHKYGGSSKGCSVCVFGSPELRALTYVPSFDGCEGLYVTPTIQGSRSGATMAACWGSVMYKGDAGYRKMARDHNSVMVKAREIAESIDGLEILVRPEGAILPIICSKGSGLDIYLIASQMEKRGWNLFTGQNPAVLGLCVGDVHLKVLDEWEKDIRASVAHVKANPNEKPTGNAAVYGSASTIPDTLLDGILREYVDISLKVKKAE